MSNKNSNSTERENLIALLERFNVSPESFDELRADAYEKVLSLQSLEALELVYALVLSGKKLEEIQPDCPTWPKGSKRAGQLPGIETLSQIKRRLVTEQTLNGLGQVSKFVEKLRGRAATLPAGQQAEVLDSVITMVGEELVQAKLTGGSTIAANLPVVDRLLTAATAKTTAAQENMKIELRKQAEARAQKKLEFDREKFKEGLRTKLESGLAELAAHIKGNPEAKKAYDAFRATIKESTK